MRRHSSMMVIALANSAALLALIWYARRTRTIQFEIAEMICMGVVIDPASEVESR